MHIEEQTRTVRTLKGLEKVLRSIEDQRRAKPDWLRLKADADLSSLPRADLEAYLTRIHACVLRGFRANSVRFKSHRARLKYWQRVARRGFHDFSEKRWMKGYDSPFVEDYDYIQPYLEGGLEALDPFMVYSSVLGTWEYSVEDFLHTELCKNVRTIVEPLAGSAELCYSGHFRYPELRWCMFDLDPQAQRYVERKPWLPNVEKRFMLGDALVPQTWRDVQSYAQGESLSYLGKQSQNYFDVKQLMKILEWGTTYTDYFILETSEPYIVDESPSIDDLTRPEMKGAGFRVALEDVDDRIANPLTNAIDFYLAAWDKKARRELFSYRNWTGWQAPTLTALGRLLDLDVRYFHTEKTEFLPVDQDTASSDCHDNNTFMLFRRR